MNSYVMKGITGSVVIQALIGTGSKEENLFCRAGGEDVIGRLKIENSIDKAIKSLTPFQVFEKKEGKENVVFEVLAYDKKAKRLQ